MGWARHGKEPVESCTILTTDANELASEVHNRMPVIIRREDRDEWLDPKVQDPARLANLMISYPASEMEAY